MTLVSLSDSSTTGSPIVVIAWLVWLTSIVWVYRDARARARAGRPVRTTGWFRETGVDAWTGGCVFLWAVSVPMYLGRAVPLALRAVAGRARTLPMVMTPDVQKAPGSGA